MLPIETEVDVPVPMRDGLKLSANVYRPAIPGQFPVIMAFTAFGKDKFWSEKHPGWGIQYEPNSPTVTGSVTFEANDPAFWVPNGYAVIIVDGRGFARSPGQMQTAEIDGSIGEHAIVSQGIWARDMHDAIEWAGVQPWSNGNVGLSGVSLLAFSQWRVAGLNPPHLKAINPWEGLTDFYRDCMFPGGVRETRFTNPAGMIDSITPAHDPAWPSPEHEDPPVGIEEREDDCLSKITVPALICATWSGHGVHARGSFRAFRKVRSNHKFLYIHGGQEWAEFYAAESRTARKLFFDCFLKGTDSRVLDIPPVRLEVRESIDKHTVRFESDFPLERTKYTELYLDAPSGTLKEARAETGSVLGYASEDGKLIFDYLFGGDTELVGYMSLKLWVSLEGAEDTDIFVTIRKMDARGEEVRFDSALTPGMYPVALGWLRLSMRELDNERSTAWEPYPSRVMGPGSGIKPGDIVPCFIPILPSGTLFRTGETVRVEIAGQYRGGEKLSTPHAYGDLPNSGKCFIHTGGRFDSHVLMPVVTNSAADLISAAGER